MRILYLADIRFPLERANGIQTAETCHALAERGHRVILLVRPDTTRPPRDPWAFYGLVPHSGCEVCRVRVAGPAAFRRAGYLAAALREVIGSRRYDVIVTRDLGVADSVLRLPRSVRPPVVYESHGLAAVFAEWLPRIVTGTTPASRRKRRRLLARERRVWRHAEGYVTITDSLASELVEHFGTRDRLATIPDGVRLPGNRRFERPRRRAEPVVAYAGHLYPWKGVDVLLSALAELPEVRGIIVGGHPREPDLARARAHAAELNLEGRVRFTGWVDREAVSTCLAGADVLVVPNVATPVAEKYTSPLKLFEYMAAGKPIVASDLPAIREILRDGENACLVAAGDPHALATGIRRVLDDEALAERIARRAFEDAANYTWARRAERIEALLVEVARRS